MAAEEKIDELFPLAASPAIGFVFSSTGNRSQQPPFCVFGANGFVFSSAAFSARGATTRAENSHPGLAASKAEHYRPPMAGNFRNALGLLPEVRQRRVGFNCIGDEITSTSNDREKFATYTRDSYTGLDYADQRFYASTYGRFNTPDPYQPSGGPSDPGSWNRYSYVFGDPINLNDPDGLFATCPSGQHVSNNRCVPDDGGDGGGDNPGGGVGRRPVQRPVKKPSPDKPTTGATLNGPACSAPKYAQASSFINANLASAQVIASQLNTTPGDILGLAGLESGWGTGFLITAGTNNYFSLTAGPAFGGTIGTYQQGSYTYGVYTSFLSSGESFANSYFGVRVEGITNPLAFATALNTNGSFNSETTPTAYDQTVANTISLANTLLSCSQATGATQ
jgi:RHS repeat-associated protein